MDRNSNMPNADGYFGQFGGSYVDDDLKKSLAEISEAYEFFKNDKDFNDELRNLQKSFTGRPSPIYYAKRLTEAVGGADIYLKREDLNHTGSHKINHALGEALLAKKLGKKKVIAETGAGQHGVALATAAAIFGLDCDIYMGAIDVMKESPNVKRMQILGAHVISVTDGTQTLKDAVDAAFKAYVKDTKESMYCLGTVAGPVPFPEMVRDFQSVIGYEAKEQMLETYGSLPDDIVACVGGGSNAIGIFTAFLDDSDVNLYGVEPGGKGLDTNQHAATLTKGSIGILHGAKTYVLQDTNGTVLPVYTIASGLDYPGVGPQHSYLKDLKRVKYEVITDREAVESFYVLSRMEGIKNILFSFTSCGWFFNDISGIEPSQNISYAVYAATLLQKYTNVSVLNSLVKELHSAKSNIESEGNGETIARTFINIIPSAARACGYYLLKNYLFQDKIQHGNYGFFNLIGIEKNTITVKNNRTLENSSFFYTTELKENGLLYFTLKNVSTGFSYSFNSANYSVNTLQEFSSLIEKKLESLIDFETVLSISENIENYLILANSNKQVAKENIFAENISLCLRSLSSDALLTANIPWDKKLYHICKLVHFIALAGTSDNKKSLEKIITDIINGYAENLYDNRECNDSARKLLDILKTARLENLNIDITNVQNKVWDIIRKNNDSENTTVFSLKQELNFVL